MATPLPVAATVAPEASPPRATTMRGWSVSEVAQYFVERDMKSAARLMQRADVAGVDLLTMDHRTLVEGCGFQPFLATKVIATRDAYLTAAA